MANKTEKDTNRSSIELEQVKTILMEMKKELNMASNIYIKDTYGHYQNISFIMQSDINKLVDDIERLRTAYKFKEYYKDRKL